MMWSPTARFLYWALAERPAISSRTAGRNRRPAMRCRAGSITRASGLTPAKPILAESPFFLVTSTMTRAWGAAIGRPAESFFTPGASAMMAAAVREIEPI